MGEKEYENLADEPAHLHFDFWLNDIEGQTLFECIHEQINECRSALLDLVNERVTSRIPSEVLTPQIEWYKGHIKFLESLKAKLHNKRETR